MSVVSLRLARTLATLTQQSDNRIDGVQLKGGYCVDNTVKGLQGGNARDKQLVLAHMHQEKDRTP